MGNVNKIKNILQQHCIEPKKSLGQNFLINQNALLSIRDAIEISKHDLVIEVGAGTGELSKLLSEKAGYLALIELDQRLIPVLQRQFEGEDVKVIHTDGLTFDYSGYILETLENKKDITTVKLVSNVPYYITTELILKIISSYPYYEKLVFTVQKEAAERIISSYHTKEYGVLPVIAGVLYQVEIVSILSPENFYPRPNVKSAVITMTPKKELDLGAEDILSFIGFIKSAFGQRRKKLSNSLLSYEGLSGKKEKIETVLADEGFALSARAQELSPEQLWNLFQKLSNVND